MDEGGAVVLRQDDRPRQRGHPDADRIERQVAWKEGEPFSQAKIADTQQNLARTGVFRSIEMRPQPVDPDNQERNVDIQLSEARRVSLLYGFGYQNATGAIENRERRLRHRRRISYRNLFGWMRSASFELQYAPISQRGHVVRELDRAVPLQHQTCP